MKIASEKLLIDLETLTKENIEKAKAFLHLNLTTLNWKANNESWSILECLEHLNLYGDYYLLEISQQIKNSTKPAETTFKSGILGNYFALSLAPNDNLKKMKTYSDKNPKGSLLSKQTIARFLEQQNQTLTLLQAAKNVSLNKTKTGISISKWIKIKLGDTFRVVIYHNQRHLIQAKNVLAHQQK